MEDWEGGREGGRERGRREEDKEGEVVNVGERERGMGREGARDIG